MFSKIRQNITARDAFELVQTDLQEVEREISVESVASVDAITCARSISTKTSVSRVALGMPIDEDATEPPIK